MRRRMIREKSKYLEQRGMHTMVAQGRSTSLPARKLHSCFYLDKLFGFNIYILTEKEMGRCCYLVDRG